MKFEKVSRLAAADFNLPVRKTKNSAGYDFEVAEDIVVPSWDDVIFHLATYTPQPIEAYTLEEMAKLTKQSGAKPTLVSTGIKCQLDEGYYLELSVRSSTPLKYWLVLANGVGIIDADYYNNPDNEGEIFFQVINFSPFPIQLKRGDIIGQGIIKKYEVIDNDQAEGERTGGFGSTSAQRGLRAKAGLIEEAAGYNDPLPTDKCLHVNFDFNSHQDVTESIRQALKDEMRRGGVLI